MTQQNRRKALWYFNLALHQLTPSVAVVLKTANHLLTLSICFGTEKRGSNSRGNLFVHFDPRALQGTGLLVLPYVSLNSELSQNGKVAK